MSRFVLISNSILLEYIYYEESEITQIGNEWVKNDNFYKLVNNNDKTISIFNADNSKNTTRNVRDYSYAGVDIKNGKYALLDIDRLVFYNDFDGNLTSTPNLPINFLNSYSNVYDKIRIHFVQNFDFEGYLGFIFDISYTRQDDKDVNFLSLAYNKFDDYRILNPNSFIFANRFFTSYIEYYVPSLYQLKIKYFLEPLNGDSPTERFSDFKGWKRDGSINISFGWVEKNQNISPNDYIYVYRRKNAKLQDRDPFATIGAQVSESLDGDYLELYPTYNGDNISQFLSDLNSVGNDYIILHDIAVSEYVGNGLNNSLTGGNWVLTNTLSISQDSGFENPIKFRPIIENINAVAYRIDYIVRLYDRNSNSQVWKRGSLLSFMPRKYAKKLTRIELGSLRPQNVVYNQITNNSISFNNPISENLSINTRFVNTFVSTNNIAASFSIDEPVINQQVSSTELANTIFNGTLRSAPKSLKNTSKTFENGALKIVVTDSGNYIRFVFKDIAPNGGYNLKDLTLFNDIRLRFYRTDSTFIELLELKNTTDEKVKGEVSFYIDTENAKRIKGFKGRVFNVVSIGVDENESVLYTGQFLLQEEYINELTNNTIDKLRTNVTELENIIKVNDDTINALNGEILNLKTQEVLLKSTIDVLRKALDDAKTKLGEQKLLEPKISNTINNAQNTKETVDTNKVSNLQLESNDKSKVAPKKNKAKFFKP